jgi:putative endonuclease
LSLRRDRGEHAEETVVRYLRRRGFKVIERNLRTRLGEIDIIALDRDVLCFIEVRSRGRDDLGDPAETVTAGKQRRLRRLAEAYMDRKRIDAPARFDVASVLPEPDGVDYIEDAFE